VLATVLPVFLFIPFETHSGLRKFRVVDL
jgi:hypothetical protein